MAKLLGKLNLPVPWTLPSGVLIQSGYKQTAVEEFKPFVGEKRSFKYRSVTEHFDIKKMQYSLMPNFIHSLDGCAIALLYKFLLEANFSMYDYEQYCSHFSGRNHSVNLFTIHDCFGTTADKAELLLAGIRQAYIELYFNSNYLETFHATILSTLKNYFKEKNYDAVNNRFEISTSQQGETLVYEVPDIQKVLVHSKHFSSKILIDSNYILII